LTAAHRLIAVTGGTGFIGRHVLEEIRARGLPARLLVRREAAVSAGFDTVEGDLLDGPALQALTRGADAVIHLAGAIAASHPRQFHAVNAEGPALLAAHARTAGVRRFVHLSSLAAREPRLSAYAASKAEGDRLLSENTRDISLAILRAPAVYGPGDRATFPLFAALTRRLALLPGSPSARFSLLYVRDLARLLVDAAAGEWEGVREVDDGAGEGHGWADLAQAAGHATGRPPRIVFIPKGAALGAAAAIASAARLARRTSIVSPGKIRELYHPDWVCREPRLSADPPTGLQEGFARTLAWYEAQGWLPARTRMDRRPAQDQGRALP
jgi:nucleoside-diphosphate-sugar epimerase